MCLYPRMMTATIEKNLYIQGSENIKMFIQQALFTDFRPIFIVMVVILTIFLLLSILPQGNKGVSFGTVLLVSGIHLVLGGMLFYTESELIQTLDLTADELTLYLFIAIAGLSILNPIVYYFRNRRRKSSSSYNLGGYTRR